MSTTAALKWGSVGKECPPPPPPRLSGKKRLLYTFTHAAMDPSIITSWTGPIMEGNGESSVYVLHVMFFLCVCVCSVLPTAVTNRGLHSLHPPAAETTTEMAIQQS